MTWLDREGIKKIVGGNWKTKLGALVSASLLWLIIVSQQGKIGVFPSQIPIDINNLQEGLTATIEVSSVKLRLIAEPSVWRSLNANSFSASIDLKGLGEGTHQLPIFVGSQNPGVQIIEKLPSETFVKIEPKIEKVVAVKVRLTGKTAENYSVTSTQANPSSVKISGPKSIIESSTEAIAVLDLSGTNQAITKIVNLAVLDNSGNRLENVKINPQKVEVKTLVNRLARVKAVGIKPSIIGSPDPEYFVKSITSYPSVVNASGPTGALKNLSYIDTAPIDLTGRKADFESEVKINIPEQISLLDDIATVKVGISFESQTVSRQILAKINPQNIPEGKIATIAPEEIALEISGPPNKVTDLSAQEIKINIDAGDYQQGEYTIKLLKENIILPEGITLKDFSETRVKMTISPKST